MKRYAISLFLGMAGCAWVRAQDSQDPFFTTALPEPDRAEIYTMPMPDHAYRRQVFLIGDGARNLAALVRAQKFGVASDVGDLPHYGLRFYRNGKLIADETICFACERITPKASDLHTVTASETFDAHTPQALQLESYIDKALPLETK